MVQVVVSADWREEFINQVNALSGVNLREQLMAVYERATRAFTCGNLTESDTEAVEARIQERLEERHAVEVQAETNRFSLGAKAVKVLAEVEDGSHLGAPRTKPQRGYQPLPPQKLQELRRRRDHQSFLAKVARIQAKHFVRFSHGSGSVLAVVIQDIKRFGFCTRSYESLMKAAGVCRATVAECMDLIRKGGLFTITRRRRNSNLITTKTGEIHNYIHGLSKDAQPIDSIKKKDSLYSLVSQTLRTDSPIGSPSAAVQPSPKGEGPKTSKAAPEPTLGQETVKPIRMPARPVVERPVVSTFNDAMDAVLRSIGLDPDRVDGGPEPQPG